MNLSQYLCLDKENNITLYLNTNHLYYYQKNKNENILVNLKTNERFSNILDLTREQSLADRFNIPYFFNREDNKRILRIKYHDKIVYTEALIYHGSDQSENTPKDKYYHTWWSGNKQPNNRTTRAMHIPIWVKNKIIFI